MAGYNIYIWKLWIVDFPIIADFFRILFFLFFYDFRPASNRKFQKVSLSLKYTDRIRFESRDDAKPNEKRGET